MAIIIEVTMTISGVVAAFLASGQLVKMLGSLCSVVGDITSVVTSWRMLRG